jgi:Regulatory subunit of type II PKA R-subunit.
MNSLDPELKTYYLKVKDEIKKEHIDYLSQHPEIRQLLNDFLSTLLLEKPEDVYKFAQEYFAFFNKEKENVQYKPLVISGPSGVGKVRE